MAFRITSQNDSALPIHHHEDLDFSFHTINSEFRWSHKEHSHKGYCEIVTCRKGHLNHRINDQDINHRTQTIIFIREHDKHSISGDNFVFTNIMFGMSWLKRIEHLLDRPGLIDKIMEPPTLPNISLKGNNWKRYESLLEKFTSEPSREYARILLSEYLIFTFGEYLKTVLKKKQYDKNIPDWLMNTLHWAHENRHNNLIVDDLIEHSHRCHEHVSRSFRKYMGMTPSTWLKHEQVEYAAELLSKTNFPVLQICFKAGFENPSYFHQCFKEHFKTTPGAYRKAHNYRQIMS